MEARETPKEHGERREHEKLLKKLAHEKREAFERKLTASIDALLRQEAGRVLFIHLFHVCGYAQADIPFDGLGQIVDGKLLYNATRRAIYLKLRTLASKELLLPVEMEAERLLEVPVMAEAAGEHKGEN